jgi:hypothetical protein
MPCFLLSTFVRFGIAKVETLFDLSTSFRKIDWSTSFRKIFCFSIGFSNPLLSFKAAFLFVSQLLKAGF